MTKYLRRQADSRSRLRTANFRAHVRNALGLVSLCVLAVNANAQGTSSYGSMFSPSGGELLVLLILPLIFIGPVWWGLRSNPRTKRAVRWAGLGTCAWVAIATAATQLAADFAVLGLFLGTLLAPAAFLALMVLFGVPLVVWDAWHGESPEAPPPASHGSDKPSKQA